MKTKFMVLWMSISAPLAFGDPDEQAVAFCEVEGAKLLSTEMKVFADGELPAAVLEAARNHGFCADDVLDSYKFEGFSYDLNKDGQPEWFVYSPVYSGSGGSYFGIFAKIDSGWKLIEDYQGGFWVFPSEKGWPRIASVGRGGGGHYTKAFGEFKGARYENTLIVRYNDGVVTEEIPK